MTAPLTTAIVVTHNSAGHLAAAVRSCVRHGLAVVVVDNASTDRTLEEVPQLESVTVVRNTANRGFAGGVNQGVRLATTPLLLLLNPDAEILDPIDVLTDKVLQQRGIAATGLLVDQASGEPQVGFSVRRLPTAVTLAMQVAGLHRLFPNNPVNRRYRCLDLDLNQPQFVEQPAGAFLLVRRDDWDDLQGLDESFFPAWFEDVDFCKRFLAGGGSIWFDPAVRIRHAGGHSVEQLRFGQRQQFWHQNLLRYASKHFSLSGRALVAAATAISILPRSAAAGSGRALLEVWKTAWKCAPPER